MKTNLLWCITLGVSSNTVKKLFLSLLLVFSLGFILRVYNLGRVPSGFHRDEAFLGYNAYSISKTGLDINGVVLPLHLKSFLYTPAGYSYISIPFIKIFGLNEFAVRFASALFGSLTIVSMYALGLTLGPWIKCTFRGKTIPPAFVAFAASCFLAVSPWHINLSRNASVITVVVFFITSAVVLYLRWLANRKTYLLLLSFVFFGISLMFYISPYSFLPLFVPLLAYTFRSALKGKGNHLKIIVLYGLLILLPTVLTMSSRELMVRANSISIFRHEESALVLGGLFREDGVSGTALPVVRAFHNKVNEYAREFLANYFAHFSYDFLFTDKGLPERYRVPLSGLFYVTELPILLFGVWILLAKSKKLGIFLLGWAALSPIGSALTFDDVPNLQRTLMTLPALSLIEAFGAVYLIYSVRALRNGLLRFLVLAGGGALVLSSVSFYVHQYFVHAPRYRPWYRHDGYRSLVETVTALAPSYGRVIITNRESAPTIFFLFYSRYDPEAFQKDTANSILQDFDRVGFGKYEFSQEQCPLRIELGANGARISTAKPNTLYVNSGLCETNVGEELAAIRRSDGSLVFRVLEVK